MSDGGNGSGRSLNFPRYVYDASKLETGDSQIENADLVLTFPDNGPHYVRGLEQKGCFLSYTADCTFLPANSQLIVDLIAWLGSAGRCAI
jgi:hypothetical protein